MKQYGTKMLRTTIKVLAKVKVPALSMKKKIQAITCKTVKR
jgi:hypothetical protein